MAQSAKRLTNGANTRNLGISRLSLVQITSGKRDVQIVARGIRRVAFRDHHGWRWLNLACGRHGEAGREDRDPSCHSPPVSVNPADRLVSPWRLYFSQYPGNALPGA